MALLGNRGTAVVLCSDEVILESPWSRSRIVRGAGRRPREEGHMKMNTEIGCHSFKPGSAKDCGANPGSQKRDVG